MQKNTSVKNILPVLFGFFIMGFCDVIGVSVTYAKEQFGWSETQAGFLPFMVFFWFLVLSVPVAILMNKIGRKNTVLLSMLVTFTGMLIPFIGFNEIFCYVAFALLGIGNTILQVSLNPLLSNIVTGKMLTSSLTIGQFIKSVSAFLGPMLAGYCSLKLGGWEMMFPIYAGATLLSTVWLYFSPVEREKTSIRPSSFGEILNLLKDNKILVLFLGILCIVGLDVGMNVVTPKLLMERAGLAKESAGYGASWYFAAKTSGTFIGALILAKISGKRFYQINTMLVLIAIIALAFAQTYVFIIGLICIIAFCASSVFSILFSAAIQGRPEKTNEVSGLMITGVSGGAIFPLLMGVFADRTGGQIGSLIIIGICAIYLLFCSFRIK